MPLSKFTALYLPKATAPDKPIRVGRDNSQARISINEAKKLRAQLTVAIRHAEKNLIVTRQGHTLEKHHVGRFQYFTCPNQ